MKKLFLVSFFLLTITSFSQVKETVADTLFRPNYPEGVYLTKEDFINKNSDGRKIWPINIVGIDNKVQQTGIHHCFFFGADLKKITKAFAISHGGHLYFQLKAIFNNCNKDDRNEGTSNENSFVRVIIGGENFYYTEAPLANVWAQGFAYGAIGGGVGSALAQSQIMGKGIVYDFKKKEFDIFKNCKDYNEFITPVYAQGVLNCKNKKQNPYEIRKVISIIK